MPEERGIRLAQAWPARTLILAITPQPAYHLCGNESGGYDAFVTKLNSTGNGALYSTYLGGINADQGNAIAIDGAGNAYVVAAPAQRIFPATRRTIRNVHHQLQLSRCLRQQAQPFRHEPHYSTGIGGWSDDYGNDIAGRCLGHAYIVGMTNLRVRDHARRIPDGEGGRFRRLYYPAGG